eukprot:scaffold7356_cov73-Cylindrotheca_fusiformis.AAC.1
MIITRRRSKATANPFSILLRDSIGSFMKLLQAPNTNRIAADDSKATDYAMYSFSCLGLLILSILPQLVGFPTATIPTILGKRFSRTASGMTFLSAILVYCIRESYNNHNAGSSDNNDANAIQTLRQGLTVGALGHLFLIIAKFVGLDGGGLLINGNGLWEYYPSMVNAARSATCLMIVTYTTLAHVCSSRYKKNEQSIDSR